MILGNSHFCERCQVDNFSQTFRAWDVDETIAIVVPFDSTVLVQGNKEKWNCKGKHTHRPKTWNYLPLMISKQYFEKFFNNRRIGFKSFIKKGHRNQMPN